MSAVLQQPQAKASVEERRGVSSTEYRIVGELRRVSEEIERLFGEYHPFGYGTRVAAIDMTDKEGIYAARMSRSNSCE